MNELAMNLATERIDDGYLKVLIVAQTVVAKFQSEDFAMRNRVGIALELNPDPVSHRDAIFHIEKEFLHRFTSVASTAENLQRIATVGKGLPRLRALARMTVMERFSETAMIAADEPSSISSIKCVI
jgi:hypothetical protein